MSVRSSPPRLVGDASGARVRPDKSRPRRRWRISQKHREWIAGGLFVLPDAVGLLLFLVLPMLVALVLGFFSVGAFGGYEFVGFENYVRMLSDPLFVNSLWVTFIYVIGFVTGTFVTSLGLALLVQRQIPFVGVLRSMFFLPHVVSLVVIGIVWQFMLTDAVGVVNQLLQAVGLHGYSWLGNPDLALMTVIGISVWFFMGYYMLIFLAALQDIPRDYHDSARVDGAGTFQVFRHVTWPMLKPTSFFVLMMSLVTGIAGLQAFDLIYVMTKGGPANATTLSIYYIYNQAFQFGNYGYAAAMASVLVLVTMVLTGLVFAVTRGGRFDVS